MDQVMDRPSASSDLIIPLPAAMTAETFTNEQEFEKLFAKVKDEVARHKPDVSTKAGRDAIASLAYKVARTKTTLIAQGKKLTEGWREQTKKVNAACNAIEERLDALKDDVRYPLTRWETAEQARVDDLKARLQQLIDMAKVGFGHPSAYLRDLLDQAENTPMGQNAWQEFAPQAGVAQQDAIDTLTRLIAEADKREREAAELEQLRAEKAERDRQEAERLAAEQAKRDEEERAERERQAEEQRKAELAQAAKDAAARAEREAADRVAAAERAAKEAEENAQRKIAEEKARMEREAEEARRMEAARQAEAEAEQRRREENKAHRRKVNRAIIAALIDGAGITQEQGEKIVLHILAGQVPNVTLQY